MIIVILLLAFVLRIITLDQSYWLDEAIGIITVKQNSLWQIVSEFPKFDNHPPLFYLILKIWTNTFGYDEISVRIMPVIFGILTVFTVYKIAELINVLERTTNFWPLIASLLFATSPLHIYYSQEVRMYPIVTLFAALAIYFYLNILNGKTLLHWILFSLSITLMVFTDYVPIFLLPIFWLMPIFFKKGMDWYRKLFLSFLPVVILFILWLPIFLIQSESGRWLLSVLPTWQAVAGGANIKQLSLVWIKFILGRISFVDKTFYAVAVLLVSVPYLFLFFKARVRQINFYIIPWIWFLSPLLLSFLVSLLIPIFNYFRFLYVLPAFYLLLSLGIARLARFKIHLLFIILLINIVSWLMYISNPEFQREDWRGAVKLLQSRMVKDDLVLFEFPDPPAPFIHYSNNIEARGAFSSLYAEENDVRQNIEQISGTKKGIWHFSYLQELSDPNRWVEKHLLQNRFRVINEYSFHGVGKISYYQKYE